MKSRTRIRRIASLLIGVVLGLLFVMAFSVYQERNYGIGQVTVSVDPAEPTREIAFIANGLGGTVDLIDIENARVIGSFDIIPDGPKVGFFRDPLQSVHGQPSIEGEAGLNYAQDTDLSPDGTVLYVARGHLGDVAAFDIASGAIVWRRAIAGVRADHMTLSPDGRRLYVSALTANVVVVIDSQSGRIKGDFATGVWPHDNHMSKDGERIYNASIGDLRRTDLLGNPLDGHEEADPRQFLITVADAQTLEVLEEYRFAAGVRPFQLNADESVAYLQLSNTHSILSYDLQRKRVANRIDLPINDGVQVHDWDFQAPHHGLALSPDGKLLCAAGRASDYAAVVRAEDLSLLGTVVVGDAPSWSEIAEDGDICVVANTRSDDVSLVSLSELREIARLDVGDGPKHVTIGRVPESVLAWFE